MATLPIAVDLAGAKLIASSEPVEAKGGYGAPSGWMTQCLLMRDGKSALLKVITPDCPTVEPGEVVELEGASTVKLELTADQIVAANDRETGKRKETPREWRPEEAAA